VVVICFSFNLVKNVGANVVMNVVMNVVTNVVTASLQCWKIHMSMTTDAIQYCYWNG
jgi:hypothetical protein